MIVPTLRVGMPPGTLRVHRCDAERQEMHSHAERGNDQRPVSVRWDQSVRVNSTVGPALAGKASGATPQHLQRTHRPLPGWSRSHWKHRVHPV